MKNQNQNNNTNKNKMNGKTNACGSKGYKNSAKNCGNNGRGGDANE